MEQGIALPENEQQESPLLASVHEPDASPENATLHNWFAIYTSPRHEKRVCQYLKHREIEHYLPLYQVRRKWRNGATVTLDLPLFPGYLFVRIEPRRTGARAGVAGSSHLCGRHGGQAGFPA
jgi:hypothetical protein